MMEKSGHERVARLLQTYEGYDDDERPHVAERAAVIADLDALTAARKAAEPLRGALVSANNYRQVSGSVPVLALIRILDALDGKAGT